MRRRQKWAALVLALLLLMQPLFVPAQAAPTVYFTAVNDYVLELSDEPCPFGPAAISICPAPSSPAQ